MKSIIHLRNPDIIAINGVRYQVIEHTSLLYHTDRKELEMTIELVKAGEKHLMPKYRLTYIRERPKNVRFFVWDKQKNWREEPLRSLTFTHPKL